MSQKLIRQKNFCSLHTKLKNLWKSREIWAGIHKVDFGTYFFIEQLIRKNRKNSRGCIEQFSYQFALENFQTMNIYLFYVQKITNMLSSVLIQIMNWYKFEELIWTVYSYFWFAKWTLLLFFLSQIAIFVDSFSTGRQV